MEQGEPQISSSGKPLTRLLRELTIWFWKAVWSIGAFLLEKLFSKSRYRSPRNSSTRSQKGNLFPGLQNLTNLWLMLVKSKSQMPSSLFCRIKVEQGNPTFFWTNGFIRVMLRKLWVWWNTPIFPSLSVLKSLMFMSRQRKSTGQGGIKNLWGDFKVVLSQKYGGICQPIVCINSKISL